MTAMIGRTPTSIRVLRWAARGLAYMSGLLLIVVLVLILRYATYGFRGEEGEHIAALEWLAWGISLLGATIGLVISFWREGPGGGIVLVSLAVFGLLQSILPHRYFRVPLPLYPLVAVPPAILLLVVHVLSRGRGPRRPTA